MNTTMILEVMFRLCFLYLPLKEEIGGYPIY